MKQPRRWAAWLAAILIAASLVVMPREGAVAGPFIDNMPPVIDEGDPDTPYVVTVSSQRSMILAIGRISIAFVPQTRAVLIYSKPLRLTSPTLRRSTRR